MWVGPAGDEDVENAGGPEPLQSPRERGFPMSRAVDAIRVAGGEVPSAVLEDFEGVSMVGQSLITTLSAEVESAALNDLIIALPDIGLELVDVQRECEADASEGSLDTYGQP